MNTDHAFLAGGGEMGERMRALDWSKTPLGPAEHWPQSLRSPLSMLLPSKAQICFFWGPEFVVLYNDAYRPVFGAKHPHVLGQPGRLAWSEIWDTGANLHALLDGVVRTGEAFHARDLLFLLERYGFAEETYFDVSYDPVRDESGNVGGVYCIVTETTGRVVGERRLALLRELGARCGSARSAHEVCAISAEVLAGKPDVPFALVHLDGELASATSDAEAALAAAPAERVRQLELPGGKLVVGLNPQRPFDAQYAGFLDLLAGQLAAALANAAAYEQERKRAEALAELDRAKTTFFSNVSHEFRTPLTLMLGPLEELLEGAQRDTVAASRDTLRTVQRNAQRLLRLVNALLDFARIEAGRIQAAYQPVDLGALCADLASNFRSACERAGLELSVDCPSPAEPAWVDRAMWEKIVLNLLSNAFKFTLEGRIEVRLRERADAFELSVSDTGTGIPEHELPRMFERFHRVEGAKGRSYEGSGIGLAMVHELVRLHGGTIAVQSEPGRGTTFTVAVPKGKAHLPAQPPVPGAETPRAESFVAEAMSWLAEDAPEPQQAAGGARVLVADDNADLRRYVARLLEGRYRVQAVGDGAAALAAARANVPDLLIADVMMPRLDGVGLLRELRSDERLRAIPVILLSARAGEEARAEGLGHGADDYLVKPFSARELLVRVESLLRSTAMRREIDREVRDGAERLRLALDAGRMGTWEWDIAASRVQWSPALEALHGFAPGTFPGTFEAYQRDVHPEDRERVQRAIAESLTGEGDHQLEYRIRRADGSERWVEGRGRLFRDERGRPLRMIGVCADITERKRADQAVRESEERYRKVLALMPAGVYICEAPSGKISYFNEHAARLWGRAPALGDSEERFCGSYRLYWPDGRPLAHADTPMAVALREGRGCRNVEAVVERPDGSRITALVNIDPLHDAHGRLSGALNVFHDITSLKRAEEALREEARVQETLNRVGRALAGELDLEATVQAVTDAATEVSGAKFGAFFYNVTNEAGQSYMLYTLCGAPREAFNFGMPRNTAVFGPTFAGEGVVRVDDITRDPRYGKSAPHYGMPKGHLPVRSYLATPVVSRSGEVIGGLFFGHPQAGVFTERAERLVVGIAAQAAIAMDNARLHEQRVKLVAQLQEADRRKDEFLATLAHELRNPLAPLKNALQLLELSGSGDARAPGGGDARAPGGGDARVAPLREMMERQVNHLVRLVDDLLEVSRISRGALELRRERVSLSAVVRSALETSQPLIRAAGHQLSLELPGEALWLDGDPVRLAQIVANLLNNAAKYTEPGGRIAIAARRREARVELSVRDNGVGIAADVLARLFEMFSRGGGPDRGGQVGLGIGLALARRLAEMHGGSLVAASEGPGRGAEFTLTLPLAAKPEQAATPAAPSARAALPARRILIVDDNRDAAQSLGMVLKFLGADVQIAHDGHEALESVRAYEPGVVFLDIGMPGMDGFEVARRIRANGASPRPAIIALTGWGQEGDRQRAREAGFDHHLVKPADVAAIQVLLAALDAQPAAH